MTRVILGADRDELRIIIDRDGKVADTILKAPAAERGELELLEPVFREHGVAWSEFHQLGVLILPHSHTSVRITATLGAVAGWVYGQPVVHIAVPELTSVPADELLGRLTAGSQAGILTP